MNKNFKIAQKLLKKIELFIVRIIFLLILITSIILFIVAQPKWVETQERPAKTKVDQLKDSVYYLSEGVFKNTAKIDILNTKADYIYGEFSQYDHQVTRQKYQVMGETYQNIVMNIDGQNDDCGIYVIGAHYDTYANLPGADDNSSGVAGLLELARLFSQTDLVCSMQLVAYTLEEPPYFRSEHMGSYVHASRLKAENVNVEMMISLEMIGYYNDALGSQEYPIKGLEHVYSHRGDFISVVGNLEQISITTFLKKSMRTTTDLPVYSINVPAVVQGIDFSDHMSYWAFDYPAVMVTDTAFLRNKNYHTEHDTAEKLDYQRMKKVVDGVFHAVMMHMRPLS